MNVIRKDEEGFYRFYVSAIDRIWSDYLFSVFDAFDEEEAVIKDYLSIADATWINLINKVSNFINKLGGETQVMEPEIIRTNFNKFASKYKSQPINCVGNIPQENIADKQLE